MRSGRGSRCSKAVRWIACLSASGKVQGMPIAEDLRAALGAAHRVAKGRIAALAVRAEPPRVLASPRASPSSSG